MIHSIPWRAIASILLSGASFVGCHKQPSGPSTVSPATTLKSARTFDSARYGFQMEYPAGWSQQASKQYVLLLVPDDSSQFSLPAISMDVPSLPPHLPGMIQIGLMQNGFLDDLRKSFGAIELVEQEDLRMADAKGRMLRTRWRAGGEDYEQIAWLIIHADRVYILRGTAREADFERTRSAFETASQSLQWTK